MLKSVQMCFCLTAAVHFIMYFAGKGNTVTVEPDSQTSEEKELQTSRSKHIRSVAEKLYPTFAKNIDNKQFGINTLQQHKDRYRRRRLLSNEDKPTNQARNSSMIQDDAFAKHYQFPDDLQEMCPFADICHLRSIEETEQPYTSCCRSCYCDEHCIQRGDCCFTTDDPNSPENENTTECIKTAIQGSDGTIMSVIKEYLVIDRCLNSEQTCKEKTSAPWGALFPGYSPETKRIYYNRHCAACNNVNDFQPWKYYIISDAMDGTSNEILLLALKGNGYPIVFIPPNIDDFEKYECFESAIKACNVTGQWQEYDPAIEEACHRFQAPVYHNRAKVMFNNIYCIVCNGKADDYSERCRQPPIYTRGGLGTALSGLIDFTTISQTLSPAASVGSGKDCPKHTVQHPYKDECRPILCPFGFTMTPLDCKLYIREWNKYGYNLRIELSPEKEGLNIPKAEFDTLTENERDNPKLWLNTQGLPTDIFILLGRVPQNTSSVSKFVLRIGGNQSPVKFDKVLSKVKRALSKTWTMKFNGYTYHLQAEFSKFQSYSESADYEYMGVAYRRGKHLFGSGYIFVSKMNFCKQVQLYDGEFVFLNNSLNRIKLNLTGDGSGKILGDGEFEERLAENAKLTIKICIEDFIHETQSARSYYLQGRLLTTVSLVVIVLIGW